MTHLVGHSVDQQGTEANVGLWLQLDAGEFAQIEFDPSTDTVRLGLAAADPHAPFARLRVEQPGPGPTYSAPTGLVVERGAYVVPLASNVTWVELTPM